MTTAQETGGTGASLGESELLQECEALVLYVARHGDVLGDGADTLAAYDCLVEAVKNKDWVQLRKSYARVTQHVYATVGVNGRSVLDTMEFGEAIAAVGGAWWRKGGWANPVNWGKALRGPRRPMTIGLILLALALALQAVVGWAGRVSDPTQELVDGSLLLTWYWLIRDLAPMLLAGLWGGIGSCIFLMKKLSDRLSTMTYEKSRQKGDLARIFVGAFLGLAIVELLIGDLGDTVMVGDANLTPNLVALAAGLATKTVYGILESVIEGVAARVSGRGEGK